MPRTRAFNEQPYGVRPENRPEIGPLIRQRQRWQRHRLFPGDAQWLAGGRDDLDAGAYLQQCIRQVRAGDQQALAAIEQDQHALRFGMEADRFDERCIRYLGESQDPRERTDDECRVIDRIQVDVPNAIRVTIDEIGGELEQESRLAYATGTDDREQARPWQQFKEVCAAPARDRQRT